MATYKVYKSTAVPGGFGPNEIHLITDPGDGNFLSVYVSDTTGTAFRRTPNKADIEALIAAAGGSSMSFVPNIAARDALTPSAGDEARVLDASADPTVDAGAARYIYDGTEWLKDGEEESLDITLEWADIANKPNSSAAAIDAAVTQSHTHANITQLDKVGESGDGKLTYNGDEYVYTGAVNW